MAVVTAGNYEQYFHGQGRVLRPHHQPPHRLPGHRACARLPSSAPTWSWPTRWTMPCSCSDQRRRAWPSSTASRASTATVIDERRPARWYRQGMKLHAYHSDGCPPPNPPLPHEPFSISGARWPWPCCWPAGPPRCPAACRCKAYQKHVPQRRNDMKLATKTRGNARSQLRELPRRRRRGQRRQGRRRLRLQLTAAGVTSCYGCN